MAGPIGVKSQLVDFGCLSVGLFGLAVEAGYPAGAEPALRLHLAFQPAIEAYSQAMALALLYNCPVVVKAGCRPEGAIWPDPLRFVPETGVCGIGPLSPSSIPK
ncbi:hypothetical protein [Novosphingobium terrae]|uniref:hypothetical protein n=1 Tax=Novosphingobium terrae TaxID=2726189 RepID=UPI00197CE02F|nr:hypothetical protein [Novosphingobium terrae]